MYLTPYRWLCFQLFQMQMLATQGFGTSLALEEILCSSSQYFIATEDTSEEPWKFKKSDFAPLRIGKRWKSMLGKSKVLICVLFIIWVDTSQCTWHTDASDNLHFIAQPPFSSEKTHQSPWDHGWNVNTKKFSAIITVKESTSKEQGGRMEMRQGFLLTTALMDSMSLQRLVSASFKAELVEKAGFETIYLNSRQLLGSATLELLTYSLQVICKQPGKGLFVLTKHLGSASVY